VQIEVSIARKVLLFPAPRIPILTLGTFVAALHFEHPISAAVFAQLQL